MSTLPEIAERADGPPDAAEFAAMEAELRRFVRERLRPAERRLGEEDAVPPELLDEMRAMGLFATSLPREYGGLGLTMEQQVRLHMELTQASCVYRSRLSTTIGLGSQPILHHGTEAQKQHWLPRMATGEVTASFGLTEPEAGSDAGSLRSSAVREGDHYVLNGIKRFITNAPEADVFVIMARTDPDTPGAAGISAFIVERGTDGLVVGPPDVKMGQAGSHTAEVYLNDCAVPAENLIGGTEGRGFKTAMQGINHARLHVAATCVGQATRLIEDALAYALQREQFGQPIAEFQSVGNLLADSRTEAYAARAMILETARNWDAGQDVVTDIASSKLFASEMVSRVADRCLQIHGGSGYMADYDVERLFRDARLFRIYEGTSQIQQMFIARRMIAEARKG